MFFILVVLFMLFVDLLKMLMQSLQSFLVESKEDKCDYGHKYHLCFLGGAKFCELAMNHTASTKTFFLTKRFLSTCFEKQMLSSPAAVRRDPGFSCGRRGGSVYGGFGTVSTQALCKLGTGSGAASCFIGTF